MTAPWAAQYIGDPWIAGEHDCWGFARRVWREQFGIEVPAIDVDALNKLHVVRAFAEHPQRDKWERIETPIEGAGVLMGKSDRAAHVGIWTEESGGGIVHCVEGVGVVFNQVTSLNINGWRVLGWYRRAD
jgi:hypothetical protein